MTTPVPAAHSLNVLDFLGFILLRSAFDRNAPRMVR